MLRLVKLKENSVCIYVCVCVCVRVYKRENFWKMVENARENHSNCKTKLKTDLPCTLCKGGRGEVRWGWGEGEGALNSLRLNLFVRLVPFFLCVCFFFSYSQLIWFLFPFIQWLLECISVFVLLCVCIVSFFVFFLKVFSSCTNKTCHSFVFACFALSLYFIHRTNKKMV